MVTRTTVTGHFTHAGVTGCGVNPCSVLGGRTDHTLDTRFPLSCQARGLLLLATSREIYNICSL